MHKTNMFERALIAVAVHPEVAIVSCAPDLERWGVGQLTLLNVIRVGYSEGALPGQVDDHRAILETHADDLRALGFDVDVRVETVDDVSSAIVQVASDFDLLVVGTRSRNLLEEIFLGSVARKVLRAATVPVLLQQVDVSADAETPRPELASTDTLRRVLLATDLTHGSTQAQDVAVALAARGATVDCVHVMGPDELSGFADRELMVTAPLQRLMERIEETGGGGEVVVAEGEPLSRLLEIAAARDASLFVVGRRGRNWPQSTLGSTALKLCERAGIPVLLVRRPDQ